ncbi:MAG TPA: sensor histidine kinase [Pseudonocardiaceae bacterium]|nr:sensor histidine kinase [Pseudonocardiaceae bacterium]
MANTVRPRPAALLRRGLFVLAMLVLTVGGSLGEAHPIQPGHELFQGYPLPGPPWPAYLLVAFAAIVTGWRLDRPWAVLTGTTIAVGVYTALGYVDGAALLAPLVALYTIALLKPLRQVILAGLAVVIVLGVPTVLANPFGAFDGTFPVLPPIVAVAVCAGIAVANRRGELAALRSRAELAERTREDEARRRVDAERLRIARELHDVVAHTMSTINVQTAALGYAHPDLPEPVLATLTSIKASSKRGLSELRAILSVLRQVDDQDDVQPVPGLNNLDSLVATMSNAGLPTTIQVEGNRRELPAPIDLAAYRIIQESLTNALRHASPATATIRLLFDPACLHLEISDTGPGPAASGNSDGSGHGLRGMTERASAVGGSLTTGAGPRGGFQVRAHLPMEPS